MIPGCEWVDEPARRLDPARRTDAQHLNHDALVAEEVAIRFADAQRGHRSGHYKGPVEYQHTRERCLSTLSETIAVRHGVGADDVIAAVGRRDAPFDAIYVPGPRHASELSGVPHSLERALAQLLPGRRRSLRPDRRRAACRSRPRQAPGEVTEPDQAEPPWRTTCRASRNSTTSGNQTSDVRLQTFMMNGSWTSSPSSHQTLLVCRYW